MTARTDKTMELLNHLKKRRYSRSCYIAGMSRNDIGPMKPVGAAVTGTCESEINLASETAK